MLNICLKHTDCIETVLPAIGSAMDAGEVCQLQNIHYLGRFEVAALTLLVKAANLQDASTGKIYRARAGFQLIGVDESGIVHALTGVTADEYPRQRLKAA
jgi:hypothetical protein